MSQTNLDNSQKQHLYFKIHLDDDSKDDDDLMMITVTVQTAVVVMIKVYSYFSNQ